MNSPLSSISNGRFGSILFAVALLPASAQPAPEKTKEEILVMSPFTVQTSKDIGYEASRTLAGMGLNTKLTDIGASVAEGRRYTYTIKLTF